MRARPAAGPRKDGKSALEGNLEQELNQVKLQLNFFFFKVVRNLFFSKGGSDIYEGCL